jgi:hypothetical protein
MNTARSLFSPLLILTLLPSLPFAPQQRRFSLYPLTSDGQAKKRRFLTPSGNNHRTQAEQQERYTFFYLSGQL